MRARALLARACSHRQLRLYFNRLTSLSPTQFDGLTSLQYAPRPHTPARTRSGTCSALLSSAFPVASLAFLPPFLCTALSYADSSIRMRHGFLLCVCVCCVDVRQ